MSKSQEVLKQVLNAPLQADVIFREVDPGTEGENPDPVPVRKTSCPGKTFRAPLAPDGPVDTVTPAHPGPGLRYHGFRYGGRGFSLSLGGCGKVQCPGRNPVPVMGYTGAGNLADFYFVARDFFRFYKLPCDAGAGSGSDDKDQDMGVNFVHA